MRDEPVPPLERDCIDCRVRLGMKLQNVGTQHEHVPLFYICNACGTTLTVPPRLTPQHR